jgi:CDGSH-type Zn-finger protein
MNVARVRENVARAERPMSLAGAAIGMRATLCRCGASKRKPYCDGSHTAAGFAASGEPATQESAPLPARNGPVEVIPIANGPLKVEGALEIVSGTGRTIQRVSQVFFCRCGASANKPFCDGTHRKIGFRTD